MNARRPTVLPRRLVGVDLIDGPGHDLRQSVHGAASSSSAGSRNAPSASAMSGSTSMTTPGVLMSSMLREWIGRAWLRRYRHGCGDGRASNLGDVAIGKPC